MIREMNEWNMNRKKVEFVFDVVSYDRIDFCYFHPFNFIIQSIAAVDTIKILFVHLKLFTNSYIKTKQCKAKYSIWRSTSFEFNRWRINNRTDLCTSSGSHSKKKTFPCIYSMTSVNMETVELNKSFHWDQSKAFSNIDTGWIGWIFHSWGNNPMSVDDGDWQWKSNHTITRATIWLQFSNILWTCSNKMFMSCCKNHESFEYFWLLTNTSMG